MKKYIYYFLLLFISSSILLQSCKDEEPEDSNIIVFIEDNSRFEGDEGETIFTFKIKNTESSSERITVNYETQDGTAIAGEDYTAASGTATIEAGARETTISISVVADTDYEGDETFKVALSGATNASADNTKATGTIRNDDEFVPNDDEGYITPDAYPGYTLVWADEFDGNSLNTSDWNYETGDHGWGNNELQNYKAGTSNATVQNGKLVIEARTEGSGYSSARITTQGKQTFRFGRIDIRAKLPQGQGIWPALWMLGESFSTAGWPHCGEIDIMELVGHLPSTTYGTIHWNQNGHSSYGGNTSLSSGVFADEFHVFTIIWDAQSIKWYLDDVLYHTADITPGDLAAFRAPFFFIMNVAVGGDWPGYPNNSTQFPQRMIVDYVRVFQ